MAQRFDPGALKVSGDVLPIATSVTTTQNTGFGAFSASNALGRVRLERVWPQRGLFAAGACERFEISALIAGGELPQWRADGRELFYVQNYTIFAVPITLEPRVEIGTPKALFKSPNASAYAVAADGQRFLGVIPAGGSAVVPPVTAILNWAAGMKH